MPNFPWAPAGLLAEGRREWLPAVLFGVFLVLLGSAFIVAHLRTQRRLLTSESGDSDEARYLHRQFRRRMQASSLLILIGVLVPIGDSVIAWPQGEGGLMAWAAYWLLVLGLTGWMALLALGDLAATRTHVRSSLSRLHQKQRELQAEADRLRAASGGPSRRDERSAE